MFIAQISVRRDGYYSGYGRPDPAKPFLATVEVHGQTGKMELNLSPEMSERVVAIIAEEIAAAGRACAEAMTAEVLTVAALPAPKAEAAPDDLPF